MGGADNDPNRLDGNENGVTSFSPLIVQVFGGDDLRGYFCS
jgi:hypothetical protein